MAFSQSIIDGVSKIARQNGISPAALLAVVQVESNGSPYNAADPTYPTFLFERHIFYRELARLDPGALPTAVSRGLANKGWQRQTQYLDQGTPAKRLALLAKAVAIHKEAAYRACSWGVGQIMGFNATAIGFPSAVRMVEFMQAGRQLAQIDCMVRFIKSKGLVPKIAARDWRGFAAAYNGAGYAANQYDTKMAIAYRQWSDVLNPATPTTVADVQPDDLPPLRMEPVPEHLGKSEIANGTLVATGAGTVGLIGTIVDSISRVPETAFQLISSLSTKPAFWICLVIVLAGGYVYYKRYHYMKEGGV